LPNARYGLLRTPLAEPRGGRDGVRVGCPAGTWMGTGCQSSSPGGRTASWRPAGARRSRHRLTPQLSASLVCVQCAPPVCVHCTPSLQHLAKAVPQRTDCRSFQSRGRWVPSVSQEENKRLTPPPTFCLSAATRRGRWCSGTPSTPLWPPSWWRITGWTAARRSSAAPTATRRPPFPSVGSGARGRVDDIFQTPPLNVPPPATPGGEVQLLAEENVGEGSILL